MSQSSKLPIQYRFYTKPSWFELLGNFIQDPWMRKRSEKTTSKFIKTQSQVKEWPKWIFHIIRLVFWKINITRKKRDENQKCFPLRWKNPKIFRQPPPFAYAPSFARIIHVNERQVPIEDISLFPSYFYVASSVKLKNLCTEEKKNIFFHQFKWLRQYY